MNNTVSRSHEKVGLRWEKLSPEEFQQLHDLAEYSSKKLRDVMVEFNGTGKLSQYNADGDVDYIGFKLFMDTYLEVNTPDELCRHLFLSFIKRPSEKQSSSPIPSRGNFSDGRVIKEMAVSSTTAVAAITPHNAGSLSSLVANSVQHNEPAAAEKQHGHGLGLVDKIHEFTEKFHQFSHLRMDNDNRSKPGPSSSGGKKVQPKIDINTVTVPLKDVVCYLSLMEGGRPEDKLEFMFRLYDTDGNGVLDTLELDCIVNQMMNVAEYLGWDVSELKPILEDMMVEIDYDSDGTVSLEEWKRGGLTTVPLLVLLGLEQNVKEDGNHLWKLKNFNRPAYCNLCLNMLVGVGKKGLCCSLCKYTVHERCVQRAPSNCITTYVKSKKTPQIMKHHWVEGNCHAKCSKCKKTVKGFNGITGLHCRWCQMTIHNTCAPMIKVECGLGEFRNYILPPISICPVVLDRQRSFTREGRSISGLSKTEGSDTGGEASCLEACAETSTGFDSTSGGPMSFQITPPENTKPILVFINPKSGGQQGPRLLRKFQYILNPRQVYDITCGGPSQALQMFKDVQNLRVICCGGDGTVGWLLDSMDKIKYLAQPAVGVIPLGTGNDLARCLKWGGGYEGEALKKLLKKIDKASTVMMDRWEISLVENSEPQPGPSTAADCPQGSSMAANNCGGDPMPYNIINNYFSVGVDAAICVKFHLEREKNPHKFNSRMRNKMWYFEFGMTEQFSSSCKNLHQELEIECDGVSLKLDQGPALQGLALLNIPYTHGGTNMWGHHLSRRRMKRKKRGENATSPVANLSTAFQDIGDRLIEVIGLENCLHMGQVRTGLRSSGRRLAQCSSVVIRTKKRFPMQIDGEPWMQPPCTIRVSHKNQVPMLKAPPKGGIFSFFKFSRS